MSFDDFLSARLRELLRLAVALCGQRALGEDVLQEVLLRAHQQWPRISLRRLAVRLRTHDARPRTLGVRAQVGAVVGDVTNKS